MIICLDALIALYDYSPYCYNNNELGSSAERWAHVFWPICCMVLMPIKLEERDVPIIKTLCLYPNPE